MKRHLFAFALTCLNIGMAVAQDWMQLHHTYEGVDWMMPVRIESFTEVKVDDEGGRLVPIINQADTATFEVPYSIEVLDSILFSAALSDAEKGHNRYRPFAMYITTLDEQDIVEKERWIKCHIAIDGKGEYSSYSGMGRIRGRGNSSWLYYKKKPYKFKLDTKSKLLGLDKAKNWNLLSNYRDVTDMMNVFAFETARWMGMPYTNHSRFVEVFLNGEYAGLYQLTEKIEIKQNRIDIPEAGSTLLSFDLDDGPSLSPDNSDNFWSKVYQLPMCVKEPEDLTTAQIDSIKEDFAKVETAVKTHNYALVDSLMDIPSFIGILQLHEFLYNVEIDAPRSLYMFKPKDGKYTFGPVWDWDAAYDFEWGDWTENHTYFSNYRELIYGRDPLKATGANYNINMFWRDLFGNAEFVKQYKETWAAMSDSIVTRNWAETQKYAAALQAEGAYDRDCKAWPLVYHSKTYEPETELENMAHWLSARKKYLDEVIEGYPDGNDDLVDTEFTVLTTITKAQTINFDSGYSQSGKISINQNEIKAIFGGTPTALVPLNADGTEGNNTAAGTYGAWFDEEGNTNAWASGHVYIESNELYSWSYGCHPYNCWYGDTHTVTMQYRLKNKAINVEVTFNVE